MSDDELPISKAFLARRPNREPKRERRRGHNSTLPLRNEKRAAMARERDFGPQSEFCESAPCFRCGRQGKSQPHHEPPRKRGGTDRDAIPLCDITKIGYGGCHQIRHDVGEVTFWNEVGCTPDEAKEHVRLQMGRKL